MVAEKRAEDVHSWVQPLSQSLIGTARLVKFSSLISKDGEDGGRRVVRL